jgi:GNAT superfamily N-acetyltransferase
LIPKITLTDTPDEVQIELLSAQLIQFNELGSGRANDFRPVAIFVTHPETDEMLGGLWGWTSFSFLHISVFYLREELRGLGLGRQLLTQAEEEAVRRGCNGVWLDTFSFQARGFYERLGYSLFGTIEEYPPGHSRFFFKKTLPGA